MAVTDDTDDVSNRKEIKRVWEQGPMKIHVTVTQLCGHKKTFKSYGHNKNVLNRIKIVSKNLCKACRKTHLENDRSAITEMLELPP